MLWPDAGALLSHDGAAFTSHNDLQITNNLPVLSDPTLRPLEQIQFLFCCSVVRETLTSFKRMTNPSVIITRVECSKIYSCLTHTHTYTHIHTHTFSKYWYKYVVMHVVSTKALQVSVLFISTCPLYVVDGDVRVRCEPTQSHSKEETVGKTEAAMETAGSVWDRPATWVLQSRLYDEGRAVCRCAEHHWQPFTCEYTHVYEPTPHPVPIEYHFFHLKETITIGKMQLYLELWLVCGPPGSVEKI